MQIPLANREALSLTEFIRMTDAVEQYRYDSASVLKAFDSSLKLEGVVKGKKRTFSLVVVPRTCSESLRCLRSERLHLVEERWCYREPPAVVSRTRESLIRA